MSGRLRQRIVWLGFAHANANANAEGDGRRQEAMA
jgi:hypothetical protein